MKKMQNEGEHNTQTDKEQESKDLRDDHTQSVQQDPNPSSNVGGDSKQKPELRNQNQSATGDDDKTKNKNVGKVPPAKYKGLCDVVFHYLYKAENSRVFLHNILPSNVKCLQEKETEKGDRGFGDCNQSFQATLDLSNNISIPVLETMLFRAWFIYQKDSESMAWMDFRPVERRAYTIADKMASVKRMTNIAIHGGAMTSPTNFVKHWSVPDTSNYHFRMTDSTYVTFEHDKELLSIGNKCSSLEEEIIEFPYSSLADTIIAYYESGVWHLFIGLKHAPKLTKKTEITKRKSTLVEEKRLVSLTFIERERIGHTSAICIDIPQDKTDNNENDVWMAVARLKRHGFSISYANMTKSLPLMPDPSRTLHLPSFPLQYSWRCLLSCGYKVQDSINAKSVQLIEENKSTLTPDVFQLMATIADTVQFFEFDKTLTECLLKVSKSKIGDEKDDLPKHFTMIRRIVVTPTHELFLRKEPIVQNRIIRQYQDDQFIRVLFRDEDFSRLSTAVPDGLKAITSRIQKIMDDGFKVGDRKYEFLACSNSQLREHGVWYFSPYDDITAEKIRKSAGNLSAERCVANYVSRLALCFSASRATVEVAVDEGSVEIIPDISDGRYCFTDGIGKISVPLAKKVADELVVDPVPSAFQIRYGGCKGVVSQDPTLGNCEKICIRESMKKFESSSKNIEILQMTHPGQLFLNRQVITLMSGLGVPDHVFLSLQEKMLLNMADMLIDDEKAMRALSEVSLGIKFKELKKAGISFTHEVFFRSVLMTIYKNKLGEITRRARIEIDYDKGRIMMGTVDETATLQYGQVFISYSNYSGMKRGPAKVHEGDVIVAKNPCFHPGDLRKFQAVNVPELHHLIDCIVFPQVGPRPHPDEMSGSDLDGDMYFVCWDKLLHPKGTNKSPMEFQKPCKSILYRPVDVSDVTEFISKYIGNDQLGVIANAHVVHADKKDIFCEECITLAKMHSDAVDSPKTGVVPNMTTELRVEQYPDYMMKSDKPRYNSKKILGKLFRQCRSLEQAGNRNQNIAMLKFSNVIDPAFKHPKYGRFMEAAGFVLDLYNDKVLQLMSLYGIETEAEVVTGIIQKLNKKRGHLQNEKFEIGQIVKAKMSVIRQKFRTDFFEEFGGEEHCKNDNSRKDEILGKASAWYMVCYDLRSEINTEGRRMVSFPWIISDMLLQVKLSKERFESAETNDSVIAQERPVYVQIGSSIVRHFDMYNDNRMRTYQFLKEIFDDLSYDIQHLIGPHAKVSMTGLQAFPLIDVYCRDIGICIELPTKMKDCDFMKMLKDVMKGSQQSLQGTFIIDRNNDNERVTVKFTQTTQKAWTGFISRKLRDCPHYKLIITFLLDWARKYRLIGRSQHAVFSDVVFVMIILQLLEENNPMTVIYSVQSGGQGDTGSLFHTNMTSNNALIAELLMNFLRSCNTIFETTEDNHMSISVLDPTYPRHEKKLVSQKLGWRKCKRFMEEVLFAYQEIAKHGSVSVFFDQTVLEESHIIINLPLDIWGSVMFAESYTARRLSNETGAEVSIRRTTFRDVPVLILEAWGNPEQLWNVQQSLQDLDDKSSKFITTAARDKTFIEGAFKCIFAGSTSLNQKLKFQPYDGDCQPNHKDLSLFIASTEITQQTEAIDGDIFRDIFLNQIDIIRKDFDKTYHGDLRIRLTFGIYYLFHVTDSNFTISDLEMEMHGDANPNEKRYELNIPGKDWKKRRGRGRRNLNSLMPQNRRKPIRGSFTPLECDKRNVQAFLNHSLFKENEQEVNYHASFKMGSQDYGKRHEGIVVLDKDLEFIELRLSDLKWMAADICRGFRDTCCKKKRLDVRCKLQSRRIVDIESVREMQDTKILLEPGTRVLIKCGQKYLYVHPSFKDRVPFVREKHIKKYQYTGPVLDNSIWQNMKIEISTVLEYSAPDLSGQYQNVVEKQEVTIIPPLPSVDEEDIDWNNYATDIWELMELLGEQFDSDDSG